MGSSCDRTPSARRRRAVAFRLAAVLLALALFPLAELAFVALDWGRPAESDDPFVGFSDVRPLFVRSDDGGRYEIARSRQRCFRPQAFAADKAPGEVRIFCLGGSTVQGRPYAVETSFTTWLELSLRLAEPTRTFRVVNCGGVSYASYRLVPILREVLAHEPDLIVLYTGHNEFLEDREYGHIRDRPRWLAGPLELLARTRTFALVRSGYLSARGSASRTVLKTDVEAILDYAGGLAKYHHDEAWRRGVIEHFRYNVRRMIRLSREAGVEMLLINPSCNLRDCPPFKSEHRAGLTNNQRRRWRALCRQAAEASATDPARAAKCLRSALAIDDQFATVHYRLGKELEALDDWPRARAAYVRAKERDVCPLRILEPMSRALLDIARRTGTNVVDARALIEGQSPGRVPGEESFCDHVHPRIATHRLIAGAIFEELARQGIVHPRPGWKRQQNTVAMKHLASLGEGYFTEGQRRLESLRGWAAGRATLVPGQSEPADSRPATLPDPARRGRSRASGG